MRYISLQQLENHLSAIVSERESQAKALKEPFTGVTEESLFLELKKRIGGDWALKKLPFKFTEDDINSIANSRFYRKSGLKILMLWAIVILVLIQGAAWLPSIPIYVSYVLMLLATVGFLAMYNKKQRESRREMWEDIEGDRVETEK